MHNTYDDTVTGQDGATITLQKDEQPVGISYAGSPASASATLKVSFNNGTTWLDVYQTTGAAIYTITLGGTAKYIPIDPTVLYCCSKGTGGSGSMLLRLRFASSETAFAYTVHAKATG